MKLIRRDDGQMLVIVALSMVVLLGFMGFAANVSLLFREQRQMQIAADAAAVAAALDYKYQGGGSSNTTTGRSASSANGVTNGTNGAAVTISCPPADGPNAGVPGFCEALLSQPNSSYWMNIFGASSATVKARAVAGAGAVQGCVWTLATSGVDVSISGSGSIDVPTCPVYDDSNASDALDLTGSGSIQAEEIGIVGNNPGYADSGSGKIQICNPTCSNHIPTTGIAPAASPITPSNPTVPTGTATAPGTSGSAFTCSGVSNCSVPPGNYSSITNNSTGTLTFSAGTYNVTGNITDNSGTIASGSGTYTFNVGGNIVNGGSHAMTLGGGTYNVVGSIQATSSGAMSLGGGTYTVNSNISNTGSGTMTLGAGNYIVNGCLCDTGSGNVTTGAGEYTMGTFTSSGSSSITLGSGLYETTGNMSLTGSGGISGSAVTFFDEGSTSLGGSGSLNLTAPTSGPYNGIAIFQPSTDNGSVTITGSGSMTFEGIVYVPKSAVTLTGSGSGNMYVDFISDSLSLSGSGSFIDKAYQAVNASALMQKVTLVE
jgi:Putative Flp pilus-assembly TadE/G-like